jgi:hypothetical protein
MAYFGVLLRGFSTGLASFRAGLVLLRCHIGDRLKYLYTGNVPLGLAPWTQNKVVFWLAFWQVSPAVVREIVNQVLKPIAYRGLSVALMASFVDARVTVSYVSHFICPFVWLLVALKHIASQKPAACTSAT